MSIVNTLVTDMNQENEEIEAIKQLVKDWDAAWCANDTDALLSLYADDPVLMPQNQPVVSGRDDIRLLYKSFFEAFTVTAESKFIEAEISDNLGYLWISYTLKATSKIGGEVIEDRGKSVFIVKRQQDNRWQITRLIDNGDCAPTIS